MTEHEKLKYICDKIGYKIWRLECWDCMIKKWLCYSWKTKGEDWICSICWYKWKDIWLLTDNLENEYWYKRNAIKEIIFTPEFMGKFVTQYCLQKWYCQVYKYFQWDLIDIFEHLNNPVDYFYNLLNK